MSHWLYLRAYHDPTSTDELLLHVCEAAEQEIAMGLADRYFYLRYGMAGYHLRFRIRVVGRGLDHARDTWTRRLLRFPTVSSVQTLDYEPEMAKYGGARGLDVAERQFCCSSRVAVASIEKTSSVGSSRVLAAAWAMTTLFRMVAPNPGRVLQLLRSYEAVWLQAVRAVFGRELSLPRFEASEITAHADALTGHATAGNRFFGVQHAAWTERTREHVAELASLAAEGVLAAPLASIACNFMHTTNNRLGLGPFEEVLATRMLIRWEELACPR